MEPVAAGQRRITMRRSALPAALAVVLVVVAACGDDDATPAPTAVSTTASAAGPGTTAAGSGGTVAPVTTDEPDATPPSLRPSDATITPATGPGGTRPPTGPTGSSHEQAAIADLAARLGVDESAIAVVTTEEVTWRDGAIGCPEPGMAYTQALVPGVRVILEVDGVRYHYHAGGRRSIFLCEHPQPPLEG